MPTDDPEPERQRSYWGCVRHGVALRVRRRVPRRHGTGGGTRAQLDRGVGAREEGGARTAARRCAGVAAPGGRRCPAAPCLAADGRRGAAGRRRPGRVAETGARRLAAAHAPPLSPVTGAPGARHLRGPGTDGRERAGCRRGRRTTGASAADTTEFGDPPASASAPVASPAAPSELGGISSGYRSEHGGHDARRTRPGRARLTPGVRAVPEAVEGGRARATSVGSHGNQDSGRRGVRARATDPVVRLAPARRTAVPGRPAPVPAARRGPAGAPVASSRCRAPARVGRPLVPGPPSRPVVRAAADHDGAAPDRLTVRRERSP
jgi:hypothetical protein